MIGELLTIGDVTGHVIRMKDPETVVLFDGKENHSLKLADIKVMQRNEEQQICTRCSQEKPINEFRQFQSERISKMCDDCRDKNVNAGTIKMNKDRAKMKHDITKFEQILKEMDELYTRKNADYGNAFDKSLDDDGLLVAKIRLGDKFSRFSNLIKNESQVKDESIRDTLIDMANYAVMTMVWLEEQE